MLNFFRRFSPAALMGLAGLILLHNIDKPAQLGSDTLSLQPENTQPASVTPTPTASPTPTANQTPTLEDEDVKPTMSSSPSPTKSATPTKSSATPTKSSATPTKSSATPTKSSATPKPTTQPTNTPGLINKTILGDPMNNPYGVTQVKVVIKDSKIVDVITVSAPSGRSARYTQYATPTLRDEVIKAQSANVSLVSGATYTSDAYLRSVQSALDKG